MIDKIWEIYVNRSDRYLIQLDEGWSWSTDKLTKDIIKQHLEGKIRVGTAELDRESLTKFILLDIDRHEEKNPAAAEKFDDVVDRLREEVNKLKGESYKNAVRFVHTGSGVHLCIFFERKAPAALLKQSFLYPLLERCGFRVEGSEWYSDDIRMGEIFPKQSKISRDGFAVRLPCGKHANGEWSKVLFNEDLESVVPIRLSDEFLGSFKSEPETEEMFFTAAATREPLEACLAWLIVNEHAGERNTQNLLLVGQAGLAGWSDEEIHEIFKTREGDDYDRKTTQYEIGRMRARLGKGQIARPRCNTLKEKFRLPCFNECKRKKFVEEKRESRAILKDSVLESINDKYIFKTPTDSEELFLYQEGVYIKARTIVKGEIEEILDRDATIGFCNEILDHLRRKSYVDREEFNKTSDYLPLANGLMNLSTLELEPHSPERIFTYKLPTSYDPDATCTEFLVAFNQIIFDKDDRNLLQEWAGYTLLPAFPHHHLLFLVGRGRNGKGTFIRTVEGVVGKRNVSSVNLEDFRSSRRFVLARLYGRLMNVCSEPRIRYELETEIIKMATGADSISAELKFVQNTLDFTSFSKFYIQANRLPMVADQSDAWWERVLIVIFEQQFLDSTGNRVPSIENRWLEDEGEKSGVLNWMLAGLKRLNENQQFTISKSMREQKTLFKQLSDTVGAFLEDEKAVEYGSALWTSGETLYGEYKKYVERIDGVIESVRAFNARLRLMSNIAAEDKRVDGKQARGWKGLRVIELKDDDEEDGKEPEPKPNDDGQLTLDGASEGENGQKTPDASDTSNLPLKKSNNKRGSSVIKEEKRGRKRRASNASSASAEKGRKNESKRLHILVARLRELWKSCELELSDILLEKDLMDIPDLKNTAEFLAECVEVKLLEVVKLNKQWRLSGRGVRLVRDAAYPKETGEEKTPDIVKKLNKLWKTHNTQFTKMIRPSSVREMELLVKAEGSGYAIEQMPGKWWALTPKTLQQVKKDEKGG